ncbi:U3 small nucleolar RNA-associated protein 14 [Auxenochlorella protothecoides]|uniref:U3 small nucleolar RNA-associated protein 14 n=1 Tax=Auxenochlorella protothecoides TaxID=3075 RepID=A0A087SIR3_AUXPR|nr:U3 small nucleolar RNA-associated protein 14 [Auxenochlorella protothecoides]KFM25617.1 U3 small nucleolar RNA-associated protein 14 [Auxenochlorella protothecoides]
MAKAGNWRGPRAPPKSNREREVENDVFEAEDSEPEEERLKNKYDRVDNYEYEMPSDFEDEEIDEDTAFTAEDNALYGHMFEGGPSGEEGEEGETTDDGSDADGSDADINLDSDEEDAQSGHELDDVFDASSSEEEGKESDDDVEAGTARGSGSGSGQEDEEDDTAHAALLAAVTEGAPGKKGRKERRAVVTEAYPEAEHNMPNAGDLSVSDLLQGLGNAQTKLGKARKTLLRMEAKESAVAPPLPGLIRQRLERKAGYEAASKDVSKWRPLVKANAAAPTIHFTSDKAAVHTTTTVAGLVDKHAPVTGMEAEVAAMLARAGAHSDRALAESEQALAARELTIEELRERQNRLAKTRALLYYHEAKAKRLKKIKSKEYRRQMKRADRRKADKLGAEEGGDAAEALVAAEEAEFARAKERLTLKHRNTSRWARRALKRGANLTDDATRAALAEQLQLGQELRRKVERPDRGGADGSDVSTSASDEEEDSEEEGGEGRPARRSKLHRTALDILEGGGDEAGAEAGGLLALPFMKRAREKQRAAALQAAERVLAEEEGRKAEGRARTSGRLQFSGDGGAAAASVRPVAAIAAGEDSDLESDEDEDVEAKAARLARHLSAERREEGVAQAAAETADRDDLFAPSTSAAAKTFLPSGSFAGARKGYTFKKGPQGVGYYIDAAGEVPAPKAKGQVQQKRQQGQQTGPTKKARSGDAGRAAQEAELGDDSLKPAESAAAYTQDDLIRMAFANDDVAAEFAAEKASEVEAELPKVEGVGTLPGWGNWAGAQREPAWMAAARRKAEQQRAAAAAARKDAKMQYVILSERWDKAAAKYRTATLPFPYDSKETYERARRQPLGKEYNTDASFRDLTRPAVVKDAGVVIEPLRYTPDAAAAAAAAPKRAAKMPVNNVVGGRMSQGRLAK